MANPRLRPSFDLFLISFVILFLELACIRWFASTVVFLTFFTNIVLLAAFVGMSVGCLAASRPGHLVNTVLPLLLAAIALACGVLYVYTNFGNVMIDVGRQGSPQQIYFGTEYRARDVSQFVVPIEAVAALFFTLIALTFAGLGQVMGRAFTVVGDRVTAYTVNIAGSLVGIAAVTVLSYLRTPPVVWFTIAVAGSLYFVPRRTRFQVAMAAAAVAAIAASARMSAATTIWSPYYKIEYRRDAGQISTNNIGHQTMVSIAWNGAGYVLPHLLNRDTGAPPFADVLVIGAGSGNDVAAALRYGARSVDAVEIDPAIFDLGRADHPDHPYSDPRVRVHIDDGRAFVRRTDQKYDLIVYALVDSLVLHSGYSSVRLESFLFTREAFEDLRAHLKPGGLFAAYNVYRQGWLTGRLKKMMTDVFGIEPVLMSLPYVEHIGPSDPTPHIQFILGGTPEPVTRIRKRLESTSFWVNDEPRLNDEINAFQNDAPAALAPVSTWHLIRPTVVEVRPDERIPEDDWPFPYLRDPVVPTLNIRGVVLMAALSMGLLFALAPVRRVRPNWRMFFMGAGFMLLETKTVVHLALLFGSTWMVNSIVIAAILLLILFSNLFVLLARPARVWPYYVPLALSLAAGILVPLNSLLGLPPGLRLVASSALALLPVFFAGIVFATAFRDSRQPDVDFGSNIGGAVLGGLTEPLSLMIGFRYLLVVALGYYGLSAILKGSGRAA